MKTSFFVKAAVVAMAAFGAFAFNGNTQNPLEEFSFKEGQVCTDILAECSLNPVGPICKIMVDGNLTDVYQLKCTNLVRHDDSSPVNWVPKNP